MSEQRGMTMDTSNYQFQASRTLLKDHSKNFTDQEISLLWNSLGLVGEAGEFANLIKKGILHRHGLDQAELIDELGDILWYISAICTIADIDLSSVMRCNIDKLKKRYPNGFTYEDSQNRSEE